MIPRNQTGRTIHKRPCGDAPVGAGVEPRRPISICVLSSLLLPALGLAWRTFLPALSFVHLELANMMAKVNSSPTECLDWHLCEEQRKTPVKYHLFFSSGAVSVWVLIGWDT
jgi:hypothetical protein